MIIKCKQFRLRDPKVSDFEDYYRNINDKEIGKNMRNVEYPYPKTKAKTRFNKILQGIKQKDNKYFCIDIDGKFAGLVSLSLIEPKLSARIGYWIGKEYRGRGIMTKAVKETMRYGFNRYKLVRIYAHVARYNKASCRVLEKTGFKLEGIERKSRLKDGKYYDAYLYAKVK